ncbi:MAG TPA: glycosyltransferase family 87 protein [Candidatus Binatia bacterium]|nr:glycosyltransferase family 87 protein [Candidatus Binatia bacterium]
MNDGRRLARAYIAVVVGLIVVIQFLYFQRGIVPGDALNYLAAGQRLNDGHPLYGLSPGDRPADINPEYWRIPLVSPPLIAVIWRPLALLGDAGPYVWWVGQVAALLAAVGMLLRRRPALTATALLLLSVPFVYEFAVGNVNSFLLLGLLVAWRAFTAGRPATSGGLAAMAAGIKVSPIFVGWWAVVTGGRSALVALLGTGVAALLVSLAGAGLDNHLAHVTALAGGAVSFSPLSLGGMLRFVGVPETLASLIVIAIVAAAAILVWRLRRRPDRGFQVAVVAMIAASPAVSINWFVLLLALLAPAAWPLPEQAPTGRPTG